MQMYTSAHTHAHTRIRSPSQFGVLRLATYTKGVRFSLSSATKFPFLCTMSAASICTCAFHGYLVNVSPRCYALVLSDEFIYSRLHNSYMPCHQKCTNPHIRAHIPRRLNHQRRLLMGGTADQATTLAMGLTTIMRQKNYGNGIFRFI